MAPVTISVQDFTMAIQDFASSPTRASDVNSYSDVKAITLAFYNGTTEVYKTTQLRSNNTTYTTFGQFSCSLALGTYTMVVVGYGYNDGDVFTLTSPTVAAFTSDRVRETFVATQDVVISSTAAVNLNATLNRVVSRLEVQSTDGKVESVAKVRLGFSAGGKGFNPTTGLATSNDGFTMTLPTSAATDEVTKSACFLFLTSDEQDINVTIQTLDASDNVMYSKVVNGVSFKRNRITKMSGKMHVPDAATASFQIETAWLDDNNVNF